MYRIQRKTPHARSEGWRWCGLVSDDGEMVLEDTGECVCISHPDQDRATREKTTPPIGFEILYVVV